MKIPRKGNEEIQISFIKNSFTCCWLFLVEFNFALQ